MIKLDIPFYLASQSPRRKKLLEQVGFNIELIKSYAKENISEKLLPEEIVRELSLRKLKASEKPSNKGLILAADTIVVIDNIVLGKPENFDDAKKILKMLSGKKHKVFTGFSIENQLTNIIKTNIEITEVFFRELSDEEIEQYILLSNVYDKAGAYGIQDYGALFVQKINGCFYNVMGLPLSKVYLTIKEIL